MTALKIDPARRDAWLQLLRAPNLLTVPGDAAAGCALAAAWRGIAPPFSGLILTALSVLFLYSFGLILNDLVDVKADRKNRTGRPLAEKTITLPAAVAATLACLVLGLLSAWVIGGAVFVIALVLAITIGAYNCVLKRFSIPGSIAMGVCRGLSLTLGAAAVHVYALPAVLAAIGLGLFIGFVTWIADHEEGFYDFDRQAFLPVYGYALAFLLPLTLITLQQPGTRLLFCLVPLILGFFRVVYISHSLSQGAIPPGTIQRSIGAYIRALIPLQAAFLLMGMGVFAALLGGLTALIVWPAARVLSHRFYAS
ncbi:MAG: UbiA family prenyltransferase [Lentisphaeria bacterium]|nr:UbiA family prenyltransferase [Lentisphaeria bacterium]